jgi:DnaJ family protein C protein 13
LLRTKAGNASLQALDAVCENPEFIWTAEMQGELRDELTALMGTTSSASAFQTPPIIGVDYAVRYRQLQAEIYVGGVYIRLFLKQPTFRLTNPVLFCEKLVEFWESSFNIQVPLKATRAGVDFTESASDSRAVVLGNEDFLTLLTSCIICAAKGEPTIVEHFISWGFVHAQCDMLKRALSAGRRGSPVVCVIRILLQLVGNVDVVDNLASAKVDVIQQLTDCLQADASKSIDVSVLPKDAAIIVELMKKIFQSQYCRFLGHFVQMAMQANLPNFLLDHVLGASSSALANVANPNALKIHTVDVLKAIIAAADEGTAHGLQVLLNAHHAWGEYRDQSHDLFITVMIVLERCVYVGLLF